MKRKPTQRQLWALALALLALLPLLAVFQYHWLGQVSEGERERKKSVLTTMARQFCHDFDSELTAIYLLLQADAHSLRRQTRSVSGRFRREIPALARNGGASEADQRGLSNADRRERRNPLALQRRNRRFRAMRVARRHVECCGKDWRRNAPEHESLQDQLRESSRAQNKCSWRSRRSKNGVFSSASTVLTKICRDCIIRGSTVRSATHRLEEGVMPIPSARSYRIIALDADYISRELIPELAGRHFGDSAGEYTIAVTKRGQTDQVVYRSDAGAPETVLAGGDVTAGFFKILFDETNRFFFAQLRRIRCERARLQLKPTLNRHQIVITRRRRSQGRQG